MSSKDLEVIERGLVLSAQSFNDENINKTWRTQVRKMDGETVSAFSKLIPPREIFIEAVCALIGRYIGIQIPKPILVLLPKNIIPSLEKDELGFASEDVEHPSIRRSVEQQAILKAIKNDLQCFHVGVFDEWIANPDRNTGNILYDGSDDFWFIDHGLSISDQLAFNTPAKRNLLLSHQYQQAQLLVRTRAHRDATRDLVPEYRNIPLTLLSGNTHAVHYTEQSTITDVVEFLSKRIDEMSALLAQRLDVNKASNQLDIKL